MILLVPHIHVAVDVGGGGSPSLRPGGSIVPLLLVVVVSWLGRAGCSRY